MKDFFIDSDGIRLHAKLDMAEGKKRGPLCILFHGLFGNMEETHLVAAQKAMNEAGVAVLRVELYGHGKSDGEFKDHTLFKWVTNAVSVVNYVKTLDFVTDLYVCGHSQGGLLTMLVGGMFPDLIKAIIPLSPAWMIPDAARDGSLFGFSFDPEHIPEQFEESGVVLSGDYVRVAQMIHPEDQIDRYTGKVLLIQGDEDDARVVLYAEKARALYKNAKLVPIHGDDHNFTCHLDEMTAALRAFFEEERTH